MRKYNLPKSRDDTPSQAYSASPPSSQADVKSGKKGNNNNNCPPRPAMEKNAAAATARGSAAVDKKHKTNAHSNHVPHVVRVTFLGVAGILANPPNSNNNEGPQTGSNTPLKFPLPSNLRAVASISRSYKSEGKASGLSNCLSKPPSSSGGGGSTTNGSRSRKKSTSSDKVATAEGKGVEMGRPTTPGQLSANMSESNDDVESDSSNFQGPERFVAVWNDDCKDVNKKLLNTSNAVAFEAELVPSKGESEHGPSSSFAPKTFCVTLGLVPDKLADETPNEGGGPMLAIPIGFSNLTVNGEETLNGRRKQLDLPLTSVKNLIGPFDVESPLIQVTKADSVDTNVKNDVNAKIETKPTKSKSIVKRMFRKGKKPTTGVESEARSIFQLGRQPNSEERRQFLERFGVDQSGDAIIRVALEVFPRGSELEKTFRQRARLRKRKQRKQGEASNAAVSSMTIPTTTQSIPEKSDEIMTSSSSLVDDAYSDNDYSQSYTQMSSDGETWEDDYTGSWGDDETYETFEDTVDTEDTSSLPQKTKSKGVFGKMFACSLPMCANDEDYLIEDALKYNIDTVASAVDSMSVSINGPGTDHDSFTDGSTEKNYPPPSVTTKPQKSKNGAQNSHVAEVLNPSPLVTSKHQESTIGTHDSDVAEVLKSDEMIFLSDVIRKEIVDAIEGHEFTLAQHSQNSFQ